MLKLITFCYYLLGAILLVFANKNENVFENQYLNLLQNILTNGELRDAERTGTNTVAIFAPPTISFEVSHEAFPLITTKAVNFRLIAQELLWMIGGSSSVLDLQKHNVKIWNANANTNHQAGFYGMEWRQTGANFDNDPKAMKAQPHHDQIAMVIDLIMHDPMSRRIMVTAWNSYKISVNPDVLPPCHVLFQIFVRNKNTLDMVVYQRSIDAPIGLPFNLASYSLLLLLLAHVTDKVAGKIHYQMGDTHVYMNTISGVKAQLLRDPFPLSQLFFHTNIPRGSGLQGLVQFTYEDFVLQNYQSHPAIKMEMSA